MRWAALAVAPLAVAGLIGCGQSADETIGNAQRDLGVAAARASVSLACFSYEGAVIALGDASAADPDALAVARDKAERLAREAGAELAAAVAADPEAMYTVEGVEKSAQAILDETRATACLPAVEGMGG